MSEEDAVVYSKWRRVIKANSTDVYDGEWFSKC